MGEVQNVLHILKYKLAIARSPNANMVDRS